MTKKWTGDDLLELVRGFQPACVIAAGAELDVFAALDGKRMTAHDLAAKLQTDVRAMVGRLKRSGVGYREVELSMASHGDRERFHALQAYTGWHTLPQVFVAGEFVGGEPELARHPVMAGGGVAWSAARWRRPALRIAISTCRSSTSGAPVISSCHASVASWMARRGCARSQPASLPSSSVAGALSGLSAR